MEARNETLAQIEWRIAALRVRTAALALSIALKAGFRPSQLRVPKGQPDGGRWTREPGEGLVRLVSRRRPGGNQIRIGDRVIPITSGQQTRLARSFRDMMRAIRDARRFDPAWKPPAQAYSTVEGYIAANRSIEMAARSRIFVLSGTRAEVGPFAREWLVAPETNRRLTREEQRIIDRLGALWGCHRCGATDPGTARGSFIGDHQVPKSVGRPTRIYPHCAGCSASQGGILRAYNRRRTR